MQPSDLIVSLASLQLLPWGRMQHTGSPRYEPRSDDTCERRTDVQLAAMGAHALVRTYSASSTTQWESRDQLLPRGPALFWLCYDWKSISKRLSAFTSVSAFAKCHLTRLQMTSSLIIAATRIADTQEKGFYIAFTSVMLL